MSNIESTLEIERIENLIGNFGWNLLKQEITDTEIILTIRKPKDTSLTETDLGSS